MNLKNRVKIGITILLLFFGISFGVNAQETPPKDEKLPVSFYPETVFTFDPILEGIDVTHDFIVKNKGEGKLKIQKVNSG